MKTETHETGTAPATDEPCNLHAAAADLLAVCRRVAEIFEGTDSSIGIAARAAISKAEGTT